MTCLKHNTEKALHGKKRQKWVCPECNKEKVARSYAKDPRAGMLYHARERATKYGVPFNLTKSDIVIPKYCAQS